MNTSMFKKGHLRLPEKHGIVGGEKECDRTARFRRIQCMRREHMWKPLNGLEGGIELLLPDGADGAHGQSNCKSGNLF